MARPLRVEYEGALYHVTARGDGRDLLYRRDDDRECFLAVLADTTERYRWICHNYCLLGTHYHLVLETPRANLGRAMRHLNGVYAQCYHRGHGTRGHVFGGRYSARLIERDQHLLATCRYVDLNPVRAGLCSRPEAWRWGSYRATVGLCEPRPFLTIEWILSLFHPRLDSARRLYREFVSAGMAVDASSPPAHGEIFLGDRDFARRHQQPGASREIPRRQRAPIRHELADLLRRHGDQGVLVAYRDRGFRLREIAVELGVHYSTVSRRLSALERAQAPGVGTCL
jgi:REP-associated tyrosine transposase